MILKRLDIFHRETDSVIDHYKSLKQLVFVDGDRPPDAVFESIVEELDSVTHDS